MGLSHTGENNNNPLKTLWIFFTLSLYDAYLLQISAWEEGKEKKGWKRKENRNKRNESCKISREWRENITGRMEGKMENWNWWMEEIRKIENKKGKYKSKDRGEEGKMKERKKEKDWFKEGK